MLNTHTQDTKSKQWQFQHNIESDFSAECWVDISGKMTKILPLHISQKSPSIVVMTFSKPYTGKALLHPVKTWGGINK